APQVFNIATVAAKVVSCGLAVASGLPVGPEGPLIHIGAALGAALSQGHSTTLGFTTNVFRRFRNPKDKRDFVTAGVAAGVAAAFNAPIGGLLFAFEEVASFWQHSLGWQIFFACMAATLTLNLLRSAGKALLHSGVFGWFNEDVVFEAGLEVSAHVLAMVPAAAVGLLSGVLGGLFTIVNLRVCRARDTLMAGAKWRRCVEPCVLVAVYVTGTMFLPLFFPCTPTKCVIHQGEVYCDVAAPAPGAAATAAGKAVNGSVPGLGPSAQPLALPLYTCSIAAPDAGGGERGWIPGSGTLTPDTPAANASTVYYNELATLLLNPGDDAIKHLFSRGAHRRFNYGPLLVMFGWYSLGAALAAGSAISSGLFVPMIMMGACLGRIVGLATTEIARKQLAAWVGADAMANPWSWIDPGAFALVGAGAFMSSVTRLTVALAVIMVEVSDDVHLLLPILTGILVAKWVADLMVHPLYHALLEVKAVPFLHPEPVSKHSLDLLPVRSVMHAPVVSLRAAMRVADIQEVLRDTAHNGFPVVKDTPLGQVFIGLITRPHLMVLLQRFITATGGGGGGAGGSDGGGDEGPGLGPGAELRWARGRTTGVARQELSWQELNRKMMDPVQAGAPRALEAQMVALRRPSLDWQAPLAPALVEAEVDLTPYVNTSAFRVQDSLSLERAYILFRSMGLRHLVVVDEHNHVQGIVTRKDVMGFRLDEALGRALRRVQSSTQVRRARWRSARHSSHPFLKTRTQQKCVLPAELLVALSLGTLNTCCLL
ncbi:MAG: voltage gated chloride channel-domain-containing protein, partial [Monoraphidium minutum]